VIEDADDLVSSEKILECNEDALLSTECLDPEKITEAFAEVRLEYDIELWAPVHGNPSSATCSSNDTTKGMSGPSRTLRTR